jgi:hypothetical protein
LNRATRLRSPTLWGGQQRRSQLLRTQTRRPSRRNLRTLGNARGVAGSH